MNVFVAFIFYGIFSIVSKNNALYYISLKDEMCIGFCAHTRNKMYSSMILYKNNRLYEKQQV